MSNIPLKTITFPGLDDTYTIPQVDNTLLTAGAAADAKKTGDEITDLKEALTTAEATLTHKADKDGTVASAEQLLSDIGTEDKAPYLFRATPYDSTRVDEELVGCSVGWNQLVGSDTSSVTVTSGHKLYTVIGGTASIVASDGTAISVTGGTDMVVDLTAWFGSTIADYAYTLEQATAGSGVAWIKALLPGGYIPYSAPKMESVSGLSGHKFTGKNQIDECIEGKAPDASGGMGNATNYASVIARVIEGRQYTFSANGVATDASVIAYYADRPVAGSASYDGTRRISVPSTFTAPITGYVAIRVPKQTYETAKYQLEAGTVATAYEPYKATTYALDSDLTLRGILKMDSDHRVYADGDVRGADGTVNRRFSEKVFTGSESLTKISTSVSGWNYFAYTPSPTKETESGSYIDIVSDMEVVTYNDTQQASSFTTPLVCGYGGGIRFVLNTDDVATAKQMITGKTVIYKVATPTTEEALPYASPQNCEPGGTEEYVYAEGGSGVPVGHNSKYLKNMRSELERVSVAVPDAPSSNGTYTLKATVTAQGVTYGWVAE